MATEYRLVVVRPVEHLDGRREFYHSKRDIEHARKGLLDHYQDQANVQRVLGQRYPVWHARIETRTVSDWSETE